MLRDHSSTQQSSSMQQQESGSSSLGETISFSECLEPRLLWVSDSSSMPMKFQCSRLRVLTNCPISSTQLKKQPKLRLDFSSVTATSRTSLQKNSDTSRSRSPMSTLGCVKWGSRQRKECLVMPTRKSALSPRPPIAPQKEDRSIRACSWGTFSFWMHVMPTIVLTIISSLRVSLQQRLQNYCGEGHSQWPSRQSLRTLLETTWLKAWISKRQNPFFLRFLDSFQSDLPMEQGFIQLPGRQPHSSSATLTILLREYSPFQPRFWSSTKDRITFIRSQESTSPISCISIRLSDYASSICPTRMTQPQPVSEVMDLPPEKGKLYPLRQVIQIIFAKMQQQSSLLPSRWPSTLKLPTWLKLRTTPSHLYLKLPTICFISYILITVSPDSIIESRLSQQLQPMPPKVKEVPLVINKKLILHFDLDAIRFTARAQQVEHELNLLVASCAWGRTEQKDEKSPVVWKLVHPSLSLAKPDDTLQSYRQFTESKFIAGKEAPDLESYKAQLGNLTKAGGPGIKLKAEVDKISKSLFLVKPLHDYVKAQFESKDEMRGEVRRLLELLMQGKYRLLPQFYKLILYLKKTKKEFAVVFHGPIDNEVIDQFNAFCFGEHPCYNGKNNSPAVKFDGSKGCKNYTIGRVAREYDIEQTVFSARQSADQDRRVCKGTAELLVGVREELKQVCALYLQESGKEGLRLVTDRQDYNTQEVFIVGKRKKVALVDGVTGQQHEGVEGLHTISVEMLDLLKDADYLIKATEESIRLRAEQIEKIQKGAKVEPDRAQEWQAFLALGPTEYLNRTVVPLLIPGLKMLDQERPREPLLMLALYCLKHKDMVKLPTPPADQQHAAAPA